MQEFQIIKKFQKLTNCCNAAQNLTNDTAKISLKKGEELIISKDLFIEDIHFLKSDGGFKIASKLLLSNISDLAASGAKPLYYMLGFSKNENLKKNFYDEFVLGLSLTQKKFGLSLIGGDTVESEKLCFSVTVFGLTKKGKILSRNAAKEGDLILVSGDIGDAFLGLKLKIEGQKFNIGAAAKNYLLNRHFFPTPRIELAKQLNEKNLSKCALDVSDGLFSDLRHICEESDLDAKIELAKLPISSAAAEFFQKNKKINLLELFSGGDDYELLFSIKPSDLKKILILAKSLKIKVSCIGSLQKKSATKAKIILLGESGKKIKISKFGYEH